MAKFHVKWPSGKELTVEKSDCSTKDEFINSYFGRNFDVKEHGIEVSMPDEQPKKVVAPAPKTVVKAKK